MTAPYEAPLRALEIFNTVPPGCTIHPAVDQSNAPHVRAGEFVVVDLSDCEPVHGELFLLRQSGREVIMLMLYLHYSGFMARMVTYAPHGLGRPPF